jgi:hypothetical protein
VPCYVRNQAESDKQPTPEGDAARRHGRYSPFHARQREQDDCRHRHEDNTDHVHSAVVTMDAGQYQLAHSSSHEGGLLPTEPCVPQAKFEAMAEKALTKKLVLGQVGRASSMDSLELINAYNEALELSGASTFCAGNAVLLSGQVGCSARLAHSLRHAAVATR